MCGAPLQGLAAFQWAANLRSGYGVEDSFHNAGILVTNSGTSPATFNLLASGGASASGSSAINVSWTLSHAFHTMRLEVNGAAGPWTIPAGATRYVPCILRIRLDQAETGERSWSWSFPYVANGVTKTASSGYGVYLDRVASGPSFTPQIWEAAIPAGTLSVYGSTVSGVAGRFAALELNTPPPSGKITATGWAADEVGLWRAVLKIDGKQVALAETTITNSALLPAAVPDLSFETQTPGDFVGKPYEIRANGRLVASGTITADANGNFNIVINGALWEGIPPLPVTDSGDEIPTEVEKDADMEPDPSHNRPDPPPLSGPDPATDPDTTLSVGDMYRAVRAAVEDTLHAPVQDYNFSDWARTSGSAGHSDVGETAGAGIGGALGTVGGLADTIGGGLGPGGALGLPTSGEPVMGFTNLYGGSVGAITPPPYAAIIRVLCFIVLVILFFLACFKTVRGAFAGQ